jgi:hypothetical protein
MKNGKYIDLVKEIFEKMWLSLFVFIQLKNMYYISDILYFSLQINKNDLMSIVNQFIASKIDI